MIAGEKEHVLAITVNNAEEQPGDTESTCSKMVQIDMPLPPSENDNREPQLPTELGKTVLAFMFLFACWIMTTTSLALVHERVPDRELYLSDAVLDAVGNGYDYALYISEVIIIIMCNTTLVVMLLHRHRTIVLRRICLILGILYLMRSITMYVTVLPVSNPNYYCSPKLNVTSSLIIMKRVANLISGMGLSINGQHIYCGDYMYSGHTVMLVTASLTIQEYSPIRMYVLHWISWLATVCGIVGMLLAKGHYTVDIIVAYWLTTMVFWAYHTMANNLQLKKTGPTNYLARVWWFPLFRYFEKNVEGVVPRKYVWPFSSCRTRRTENAPTRV